MTIDPSQFIKITEKEDPKGARVTGSFVCQTCLETINFAVLDEDEMILKYTCPTGHDNEAKL